MQSIDMGLTDQFIAFAEQLFTIIGVFSVILVVYLPFLVLVPMSSLSAPSTAAPLLKLCNVPVVPVDFLQNVIHPLLLGFSLQMTVKER